MKVIYALWYGGGSYAVPHAPEDTETFHSQAEAVREFKHRADPNETYWPTVDSDAEMWLFTEPPPPIDAYPNWIVKFGARGGVVIDPV